MQRHAHADCRAGPCLALVAMLLMLVARTAPGETGRFEVVAADSRLADGVYFVSAEVDFRLSDAALDALDSGLTLTVELQLQVLRERRLWVDSEIATLEQDYLLSYQPLSQRYVVRNLNSGQQQSFPTLFAALNELGRIDDLPLIDAPLLEPDTRHRVRLRAVLDQNTLPGPLRLIAFWSEGFRLESRWYEWTLSD